MHVLVTGGAGYIGAITACALLERGHRVTVVDDLSNGHRDAVPAGATFHRIDIGDGPAIAAMLRGADIEACLHFAAVAEAGRSMVVPQEFFRVNTAGTAVLLEELVRAGVDRFVLSSTCAVYGDPVDLPLTEDHPKGPTNPYGESKLLVERMLRWHRELNGMRIAALRYFNAAGATATHSERHADETHLIPLVLEAAIGSRPAVTVLGTDYPTPDGTAVRDYVHVSDLADAHIAALHALDTRDDVTVNLGTGRGHSVREVIAAAERVSGRTVPTVDGPRRAGDPAELVADATRAREVLGWVANHPDIDAIVGDAWAALVRRART